MISPRFNPPLPVDLSRPESSPGTGQVSRPPSPPLGDGSTRTPKVYSPGSRVGSTQPALPLTLRARPETPWNSREVAPYSIPPTPRVEEEGAAPLPPWRSGSYRGGEGEATLPPSSPSPSLSLALSGTKRNDTRRASPRLRRRLQRIQRAGKSGAAARAGGSLRICTGPSPLRSASPAAPPGGPEGYPSSGGGSSFLRPRSAGGRP